MRVTLIAKTNMLDTPASIHGTPFDEYYSGDSGADADELATELLRQLRVIAPSTYQDFPDTPFS